MKKLFASLTSILMVGALLVACGESASSSSVVSSKVESEVVSSSEISSVATSSEVASVSSQAASSVVSVTETPAAPVEGLGDTLDLNSMKVALDGMVFAFPGSTYDDFVAGGWSVAEGYAGTTLPANSAGNIDFVKGDNTIRVSIANYGTAAAPIEQCSYKGFNISLYDAKTLAIMLPGDIDFNTATVEQIVAAYGEPQKRYPEDVAIGPETSSIDYKEMGVGTVQFRFYEAKPTELTIGAANDVFR